MNNDKEKKWEKFLLTYLDPIQPTHQRISFETHNLYAQINITELAKYLAKYLSTMIIDDEEKNNVNK